MGGVTAPTCVVCGAPTPDGYACAKEAAQAAQKLAAIVDLAPEARRVAYGLQGRSQGGASGKPGSRSPGNDDALDALTEIQNCLTGWARVVAEERGRPYTERQGDPIVIAAEYLMGHGDWWRHQAFVDEAYADFEKCARRIRGVVDGPSPKRYLGPCGAPTVLLDPMDDEFEDEGPPCEGDVYGTVGGKTGTCRTCGAQVDQDERRAWLDDQVRDKAFRAAHIADAYGINVKTIRSWADRGPLLAHGHDREGRPLYLVGDVLDLAAQAAARRAENEAKRERRSVAA